MHIWRSADWANWKTVGFDVINNAAYTNWWGGNLVVFIDTLYMGTNPWFYRFCDRTKYKGGQPYRFQNKLYTFSNDLAGDRSSGDLYY